MMKDETTKILIVDDDPAIGELLARYLGAAGHESASALDAETALNLLKGADFQLVIADIMLPGMSGIDLLNIIRQSWPDIAVLMITGVDDPDAAHMAMGLGAQGCMVKPINRNELLVNVANALKKQRGRSPAPADQRGPEEDGGRLSTSEERLGIAIDEALKKIRAGASDAELMVEFDLSSETLCELVDHLVIAGDLPQSEVDKRLSLSPGSVAVDTAEAEVSGTFPSKPVISAKDAVDCIRSGMDDVALMNRYGISAAGLRNLFKKLLNSGLLGPEEFYGSSRFSRETDFSPSMKKFPLGSLSFSVPVCEPERPEIIGSLKDVTDKGIGVAGIEAKVGETKSFVIFSNESTEATEIRFEAVCTWFERQSPKRTPFARFRVREISEESVQRLRELLQDLAVGD